MKAFKTLGEAKTFVGKVPNRSQKNITGNFYVVDFKVKETAFRAAQALGVTSHGNPIYLGKGKKGNLVKGINKKLEKVRNSLPDDYSFEDFKSEFQKKYPSAFFVPK